MAVMNTSFDPGKVLMGPGNGPYVQTRTPGPIASGNPGGSPTSTGNPSLQIPGGPLPSPNKVIGNTPTQSATPAMGPGLAAETVRATGTGPFDAAYRQNLATNAGGNFMRPGGNLSFNPTDLSTFPGNPTGGGTAPLPGLPNSLIGNALGGNPFSYTAPQPQPSTITPDNMGQPDIPDWRSWLQQFRSQGNGFGLVQ